eukprot:scaffold959_cov258-Pinguiococcus_pyrenoidosus.AAC.1
MQLKPEATQLAQAPAGRRMDTAGIGDRRGFGAATKSGTEHPRSKFRRRGRYYGQIGRRHSHSLLNCATGNLQRNFVAVLWPRKPAYDAGLSTW